MVQPFRENSSENQQLLLNFKHLTQLKYLCFQYSWCEITVLYSKLAKKLLWWYKPVKVKILRPETNHTNLVSSLLTHPLKNWFCWFRQQRFNSSDDIWRKKKSLWPKLHCRNDCFCTHRFHLSRHLKVR